MFEFVGRVVVRRSGWRGRLLERFVVPVKLRGFPVRNMFGEGVGPLLTNIVLAILPSKARPQLAVVKLAFADLFAVLLPPLVLIEITLSLGAFIRARGACFAVSVFG